MFEQLPPFGLIGFYQRRIVHLAGKNSRDIAGMPHETVDLDATQNFQTVAAGGNPVGHYVAIAVKHKTNVVQNGFTREQPEKHQLACIG